MHGISAGQCHIANLMILNLSDIFLQARVPGQGIAIKAYLRFWLVCANAEWNITNEFPVLSIMFKNVLRADLRLKSSK